MSFWKGKEGYFQRQLFVFSKMFANMKPPAPTCETKELRTTAVLLHCSQLLEGTG